MSVWFIQRNMLVIFSTKRWICLKLNCCCSKLSLFLSLSRCTTCRWEVTMSLSVLCWLPSLVFFKSATKKSTYLVTVPSHKIKKKKKKTGKRKSSVIAKSRQQQTTHVTSVCSKGFHTHSIWVRPNWPLLGCSCTNERGGGVNHHPQVQHTHSDVNTRLRGVIRARGVRTNTKLGWGMFLLRRRLLLILHFVRKQSRKLHS